VFFVHNIYIYSIYSIYITIYIYNITVLDVLEPWVQACMYCGERKRLITDSVRKIKETRRATWMKQGKFDGKWFDWFQSTFFDDKPDNTINNIKTFALNFNDKLVKFLITKYNEYFDFSELDRIFAWFDVLKYHDYRYQEWANLFDKSIKEFNKLFGTILDVNNLELWDMYRIMSKPELWEHKTYKFWEKINIKYPNKVLLKCVDIVCSISPTSANIERTHKQKKKWLSQRYSVCLYILFLL